MSKVFVVDANRKPLDPVHPGSARVLLTQKKAAVLCSFPFTLILREVVEQPPQPLRVKLDPGSQTTGIAIMNDATGEVVFAAELTHRGSEIKKALDGRRGVRRGRRQRETRYRKPRFANRRRREGWLAPSTESRVCNVVTWVKRLMRVCPIAAISQELVKFNMQAMEKPEIQGTEYQQGTLQGYETREYLLEKWGRQCSYCGATNVPLQIEHIQCRAKGGSNRVSNLCLACEPCNLAKGTQDIAVFLAKKPDLLKRLLDQAKVPLKDAAAVNGTRWALYHRLEALGLPVECGTGGRTKFNRVTRGLEKIHWIDASCVGASTPDTVQIEGITPLLIRAYGHGCRQMCLMDALGFPRTKPKQKHFTHGFRTGISSVPRSQHISSILGCMWAEWQPRRKAFLRSPRRKESFPMSERTIVAKSSEPMAMDTSVGLRRRPVIIPPWLKPRGPLTTFLWRSRRLKQCHFH
jgi:5-methylcytosine-specific restriction endonuclease McrA